MPEHYWDSVKFVFSRKELLVFALLFAVADGAGVNMKWFYAPIFTNLALSVTVIGGLTALLYVAKSVLMSRDPLKNVLVSSTGTMGLFFILGIFFSLPVAVGALLGVVMATEAMDASSEELVHGQLNSAIRATAMSSVNLLSSLVATMMLNGFGMFQFAYGVRVSLLFLSGVFFISTLLAVRKVGGKSYFCFGLIGQNDRCGNVLNFP